MENFPTERQKDEANFKFSLIVLCFLVASSGLKYFGVFSIGAIPLVLEIAAVILVMIYAIYLKIKLKKA